MPKSQLEDWELPTMCAWVPKHYDDYGEEGGCNEEWTVLYWYCCTQEQVLSQYTIDDRSNVFGREEAEKKKCNCNENLELIPMRICYNHISRKCASTPARVVLGTSLFKPPAYKIFHDMYTTRKYTDYTIIVADRHFAVHKFFLNALSPMFERLFQSPFVEAKTEYVLRDEDPEHIGKFLDCLYMGYDMSRLPFEEQLGFIDLALALDIDQATVRTWAADLIVPTHADIETYRTYRQIMFSFSKSTFLFIFAHRISATVYRWEEGLDSKYQDEINKITAYLTYKAQQGTQN